MAKALRGCILTGLNRTPDSGGQVPPNPVLTPDGPQAKARIGLTLLRMLGNQRCEFQDLGRNEMLCAQVRRIDLAADLAKPDILVFR